MKFVLRQQTSLLEQLTAKARFKKPQTNPIKIPNYWSFVITFFLIWCHETYVVDTGSFNTLRLNYPLKLYT